MGTFDTNDNTKQEDALSVVSQLIHTTESNNIETAVKETKQKIVTKDTKIGENTEENKKTSQLKNRQ